MLAQLVKNIITNNTTRYCIPFLLLQDLQVLLFLLSRLILALGLNDSYLLSLNSLPKRVEAFIHKLNLLDPRHALHGNENLTIEVQK